MNQIMIIGNLAADPEIRATKTGKEYTFFKVYVHDLSKKDNVEIFSVYAWEGLGKVCKEFLGRGAQVAVQGKIGARAYKDREGNPKAVMEITAKNVEFMRNPKPCKEEDVIKETAERAMEADIANITDIPF